MRTRIRQFISDTSLLLRSIPSPVITILVLSVVLMNRAYVLAPIVESSDAVLLAYRPGVTVGAYAVADALFGETPIAGRTPFQIPATMDQVLAQREDLPKDIVDPLFDYGFGRRLIGAGREESHRAREA